MDFGDLKDAQIQEKILNFHKSIEKIDELLDAAFSSDVYDKLSTKEKIDHDLFIAYTLNTLYWLFLRARGEDPNKNDIKNQLNRIKEYMLKAKRAHERMTIRPKINKPVAARFVKHGISHSEKSEGKPPNKKIKFDD